MGTRGTGVRVPRLPGAGVASSWKLIYINSEAKKTIALGLGGFINVYKTEWHWLMAASVVMTLPTILLFFVAQRYFIQGIVLTGMKG